VKTLVLRRAVALVDSIDRVLIAAGARACEHLKSTSPRFSAATLNRLSNAIPLLLALLTLAAMFTTPATILLSIIVVLPTAFRIWIVHSVTAAMDPPRLGSFTVTPDEEFGTTLKIPP
jgi:hypothetical protein